MTRYLVLGRAGNPIMQKGDTANSYLFYSLIRACLFAESEKKREDGVEVVEVVELISLDKQGSGM